jgi:replicative DNA helicase
VASDRENTATAKAIAEAPPPPPHDLEAERSVIAGVLLDNESWHVIEGIVGRGDFYHPSHAVIFAAVESLIRRHEPVDVVTLANELRAMGRLNTIGGSQYLAELTDFIPTVAHIATHARLVADLATSRRVIAAAQKLMADAQAGVRGAKLAERAELLATVAGAVSTTKEPTHIRTMIERSFERMKQRQEGTAKPGVATGFPAIDELMNPMRGGQVIVVGGRPSSGKTSLVNRWFVNAAMQFARELLNGGERKSALFFSLETKEEDLADRTLCMNAPVNLARMQRSAVDGEEYDRLGAAAEKLYQLPLYFDDSFELTLPTLRRVSRTHKRKHGLGIIGIDFLQLMKGDKRDGREREVSELSRGLKSLAKELDVPIVALAQMNRDSEGRNVKDHRPQVAELRDSGGIEQDADVIGLMYRECMYDKTADPLTAEFIVAKQKNGPRNVTAHLRFVGESARFETVQEEIPWGDENAAE